jgi:hypothetical protein
MADAGRTKGMPRFPVGIRKRDAKGNKNKSEVGSNKGRSAFSTFCPDQKCKRSYSGGGKVPPGIRTVPGKHEHMCPTCFTPIPKNGWIS